MRNTNIDVLFVPIYLQAHFLLKALFSVVYATFIEYEFVRVSFLLLVNIFLLLLNIYMKPCSLNSINAVRTASFCGSVWAGICGLISLTVTSSESTSDGTLNLGHKLFAPLLIIGWVCLALLNFAAWASSSLKSTAHAISIAFVELEVQQREHKPRFHPRLLEPLISLALSTHKVNSYYYYYYYYYY